MSLPYPLPAELFASVCARGPGRIALKGEGHCVSYGELEQRTARRAAWMADQGVRPLDRVGILVADPCGFIEWLVAIVRIGAVYVPIDAAMAPETVVHAIAAAQIRFAITDTARAGLALPVPKLAEPPAVFDGHAVDWAPGPQDPNDPVCIMFTSGSTGVPKGVVCPLGGIVPLVMGDGHLPIEPDDVVLQISAREFDAFTWEIWGALLNGACLQLLPPGWSVSQLGRAIEDGGVTAAFFTARLFDLLVESAPQTLAGMRLVSFGGEAASPRHCAMARTLFPGVLLINGYGPTENTTFTCSYRLGEGVETEEMVPIGTARNGDITLLLDPETLDPIEGEGTGELYVGGPGLALGYTDPALTAERFVTHPRLGLKLFKTNDWVQRLPGGQLHFLGRIDRQVKVRGFRVDLSQVERALCLHPDVLSAHVVFETVLDRQEIVAFLRTRSGHPIGRPELQHFLDGRLDLHAFPNWFEHVDALPLKGNGKADVAELVRRFRARVAPAPVDDPLEALWRRMLFPAEITESTNFFAEGGDSFAALNLILETERIFGITLPADYLARNPVLADFRAKLESAGGPSLVNPPEAVDGAPLLVLLPWLNGRPDTFGNLLPSLAFDGQVVTIDMTQIECDMTIGGIGDISRILADAIAPLDPGPISVAGPSLAGAIALDLGAELTARGFAVDTIIILDGYAPWLISLDKALETVSRTFSRLQGKREAPYRPRSDALPAPAGAPRPLIDRLLDRLGSFSRFEPRIPQARSIHLVMAAETHANRFIRRVPLHGWKRAVPQISGSFAAGDHLTMLNAVHGPALARLISQILSKDDQRTSTIARNLTQVQRTRSAR